SITKFAREDGTNFEEKMCRFIVSANLPFSIVENVEFIEMLRSLRSRVQIPYRRKVIEELRKMKGTLDTEIQRRLVDQHVSITTDGWTASNNDTYMSLTCSFITSDFNLEA
ncbi:unnamed protein product, partial [Ectocarpus sp. 12 AP-2014]